MLKRFVSLCALVFVFSVTAPVFATEYTSTTCTAADIQAKMNQANQPGDGVFLDCAGVTYTATPTGSVCAMEFIAPPNAYLRGRGSTSIVGGNNQTVLVDAISRSAGDKWLLCLTLPPTGVFRMYGITVRGSAPNSNGMIAVGEVVSGSGAQFRIHHSSIEPVSGIGILFSGQLYGVVDHSVFNMTDSTGMKYWASYWGGGSNREGDGSWADDTTFGSNRFVYAEDNVFISNLRGGKANSGVQDSYLGSRFVVRFNRMVNGPATQTHPTGGSGRARGTRACEIYGNTFEAQAGAHNYNVFFYSSGTCLVWGNSALTGFDNFVTLHSMRRDSGTYPQAPTPAGWGYSGTSFTGVGSNWDGNQNVSTGYPSLDQPGRGKGDLLAGDPPRNLTRGCDASVPCWPRQALEPFYEWNNAFSSDYGSPITVSNDGNFTENLDYYRHTPSFNGTSGVGAGTRANRPASTTNGVAYWSNDAGGDWNKTNTALNDGCLDVVKAGAWVPCDYIPAEYPHRLVSGASTPQPQPTPTPTPVPVPCPLKITVTGWAKDTGSTQGRWNTNGRAVSSAAFFFNPTRFEAVDKLTGCKATVTK